MSLLNPLDHIRVIDFTTLLPGPLATLFLARCGAEVIKIEPPGGDPIRTLLGDGGETFDLLNRGKRSICVDLKESVYRDKVLELISEADVLVEQFRPGVMARLGLDYQTVSQINPRMVYASITGYGQSGKNVDLAGHDINYIAETGLFDLLRNRRGEPFNPPFLLADIVGGAWPTCLNVLLGLVSRNQTGRGSYLDVSMTRGMQSLAFWAVPGAMQDQPAQNCHPHLGGSLPRYRLYQCRDGKWLALGALEEKFWQKFCELVDLPVHFRGVEADASAVHVAVEQLIGSQDAAYWLHRFGQDDVCCNLVRSLAESLTELPGVGLPLPISPDFDQIENLGDAESLGASNARLGIG